MLNGKFKDRFYLIPKISLRIDHDSLPITFNRHQFPVVVAFAITINKSQGQTLDKCGLYLK